LKKFQNEIIVALALILLGSCIGYTVSENGRSEIVIDAPDYNIYEKPVTDINNSVYGALTNPTNNNLVNVQQDLFYTYYPWAERQVDGQQKEIFVEYLEACNQIIISISKGLEPDTGEMIRLKNELI